MAKPDLLIPFILAWEGGFVEDPADRGGATNKGVTISTFRHFYGGDKTIADLRNITDEQWRYIFKTGFWDRWHGDDINSQPLANLVVDWLWHSGRAGIILPQQVLGVTPDGVVGRETLHALNSGDSKQKFEALYDRRTRFLKSLSGFQRFGKGWIRRLEAIRKIKCDS